MAALAKLSAGVQLSLSETGSVLDCDADVRIGGKLAAIGNRLFESASRKNIDSFFDAFVAHVRSADKESV
jgi:carbon monoxide dehydrogenase subunit G